MELAPLGYIYKLSAQKISKKQHSLRLRAILQSALNCSTKLPVDIVNQDGQNQRIMMIRLR